LGLRISPGEGQRSQLGACIGLVFNQDARLK
jgi:hypothetical protein